MGRRRDHRHQDKKPRTLARDFRTPRPNTWRQGTGSERDVATPLEGQPDMRLTNAAFETYYKARALGAAVLATALRRVAAAGG